MQEASDAFLRETKDAMLQENRDSLRSAHQAAANRLVLVSLMLGDDSPAACKYVRFAVAKRLVETGLLSDDTCIATRWLLIVYDSEMKYLRSKYESESERLAEWRTQRRAQRRAQRRTHQCTARVRSRGYPGHTFRAQLPMHA